MSQLKPIDLRLDRTTDDFLCMKYVGYDRHGDKYDVTHELPVYPDQVKCCDVNDLLASVLAEAKQLYG
jgi:hypothetical protein